MSHLDDLIERTDLDGMLELCDRCFDTADWDGLIDIRDRARAAVDGGHQLWPAAHRASYLVALTGPPALVGMVIDDPSRVSPGPLTEVAACHHTWVDLEPHLPEGPARSIVAHERVVRGEPVDEFFPAKVLDLPLRLARWEPSYCLAAYERDGCTVAEPSRPPLQPMAMGEGAHMLDDQDVLAAFTALAEEWSTGSEGQVTAVAVQGDAMGAVAAAVERTADSDLRSRLDDPSELLAARISSSEAIALMAWAGASGGVHGRRRGAAAGRFGAWWVIGALGAMLDDWPPEPSEIGDAAAALEWWLWSPGSHVTGWALHLAVEDPESGSAWALAAHDRG